MAIRAEDLNAIELLVAEGVNVGDVGDGNITPLLWAFDGHLPCRTKVFEVLLKAGADPNTTISKDLVNWDLGVPEILSKGTCVTLLASRARWPEFLKQVLANGGDPNVVHSATGETPLHSVLGISVNLLGEEIDRRVKLLVEAGADVDAVDRTTRTPAMVAATWRRWVSLKYLLRKNASPAVYDSDDRQLIHHVAISARMIRELRMTAQATLGSPEQLREMSELFSGRDVEKIYRSQLEHCDQYDEVVALLAERGFDLAEAERDLKLARHYAEQGDSLYFRKRRRKREAAGLDKPQPQPQPQLEPQP